jgi:CDP-6-deoxy-D-xylo-4-hexulose-3-dehydrase
MGSKYKNKYLGSFGYASFFSMYFGHHLSTIEGGFVNTDDEDFYHLLLMMRSHGWDRDLPEWKQNELRVKYNVDNFTSLYNFYVPGFNLRATDLQAFIGLRAIDKLDNYSLKRNENFKQYLKGVENSELNIVNLNENFISNFAFPIVHKNKQKIIDRLQKNNIEVRPLIAGDMSKKPMWYEKYGNQSLPNCELVNEYGFYIPNHQDLTETQINIILNIINDEV